MENELKKCRNSFPSAYRNLHAIFIHICSIWQDRKRSYFYTQIQGGERNKNQKEHKPKIKGEIPISYLSGRRPDYSGAVPAQI